MRNWIAFALMLPAVVMFLFACGNLAYFLLRNRSREEQILAVGIVVAGAMLAAGVLLLQP